MRLVAIRITEGDVHAGKFFVLKKIADHLGEAQVGAEGQLADAVAVFVGVAIVPEFLVEILALAFDLPQTRALDFEDQRGALQISVLTVEVIASAGIADEGAVHSGRSREHFTSGKIGPVARTDESAGLDPIEAAIEMGGEFGACVRLDG